MRKRLCLILLFFSPFTAMTTAQGAEAASPPTVITVENASQLSIQRTFFADNDDSIMQDVIFSPDNNWLAVIERNRNTFDGKVRFWDAKTFEEKELVQDDPLEAMSITFSPDSSAIVSGDSSGEVRFTNLQTGKIEANIRADASHVNSVAVNPKEPIVAIAGSDLGIAEGNIAFSLINFESNHTLGKLATCTDEFCPGPSFATAFDPLGDIVAFAVTLKGTVRIWDAKLGKELASIEKADFWVNHMIFTPDGSSLIFVASEGIRIWNVKAALQKDGKKDDFRVIAQPAEGEFIQSIALSPDGIVLAAGYLDNTIKLWNIATGEQLTVLTGHSDRVMSLAFSPDGTLLATGGGDGTVRLWGVPAAEK